MTLFRLAARSAMFYRRPHAAVVLGVASAVAVLAGSLLVGGSVRASLADITTSRLGRTDVAIVSERPFTTGLAARTAKADASIRAEAPLLALNGFVRHDSSGRRAGRVSIYGVDARFFAFHGVTVSVSNEGAALLSPALGQELGAARGDSLLVRVTRPTDIPADSLHGRKDEGGKAIRLRSAGTLPSSAMGDFSLAAGQAPVRAVFVNLARLQRELDLGDRANAILLADSDTGTLATQARTALASAIQYPDLGLTLGMGPDGQTPIVESTTGLIADPIVSAIVGGAPKAGVTASKVLTWLANTMTTGTRSVPYSIVTALGPDAAGDATLARLLQTSPGATPPIVLNAWAAERLGAKTGDTLDLEYYRWSADGRLVTDRAEFRVAGTLPMSGLAVDRRLAPDYPGITQSRSFREWDPPFPIDLGRVHHEDEAYWDRYRAAPKAFVPLEAGQLLWVTQYGKISSIRLRAPTPDAIANLMMSVERSIDPIAAGFSVIDVRRQNLAASAGATDFGAYFSYFSFFLMASALLLAGLFLRLSLETRQSQAGVLRAAGYPLASIRRLFLMEGAAIAVVGAVIGVGLAVGWAALMMTGLRTWWVGAVGTTALNLHVDAAALAIGAAGGVVAALVAVALTVRSASRTTPRALITGAADSATVGTASRAARIAAIALVLALALSGLSAAGTIAAAGGFFGAAALVLIAGISGCADWLRRRRAGPSRLSSGGGVRGLMRLGLANASWRPGRSVTAVGLVAAAVFLLVSVDAFRKRVDANAPGTTGTGGFALIAESEMPIVHDLSSPEGWLAAGLDDSPGSPLAGVALLALRLRPGDDASCLNLYQPRRPRVVGVPERMIDTAPFRFAKSVAANDAERANPWRLLRPAASDGAVPAIVDATSLQYVLHAAVGDVITVDADTAHPIQLRIVASLDDSVLQGEILIGDAAFRRLFPDSPGYRVFLAAIPNASAERREAVAAALESALSDFGFDAEDAARRLEAFHRVENTYLSTFQALGALWLMLGCLALVAVVARNVLERRRELALLGASGFTGRDLQVAVAAEHLWLVGVGLVIGVAAAVIAVAPVAFSRSGGLPVMALVWLIPVALTGLLSVVMATRNVSRLPLVQSLRND